MGSSGGGRASGISFSGSRGSSSSFSGGKGGSSFAIGVIEKAHHLLGSRGGSGSLSSAFKGSKGSTGSVWHNDDGSYSSAAIPSKNNPLWFLNLGGDRKNPPLQDFSRLYLVPRDIHEMYVGSHLSTQDSHPPNSTIDGCKENHNTQGTPSPTKEVINAVVDFLPLLFLCICFFIYLRGKYPRTRVVVVVKEREVRDVSTQGSSGTLAVDGAISP